MRVRSTLYLLAITGVAALFFSMPGAITGVAALFFSMPGAIAAKTLAIPAAPTNARGHLDQGHVVLTWDAATGATTYNIYRGTSHDAEGTTPYKTGVISTTFTNTLVAKNTTYYYQVTAVNTEGESAPSNEVSVSTTPVTATPTPTPTQSATPAASASSLPQWLSKQIIIAAVIAFLAGILAGFVFGRASARSRAPGQPNIPIGESAEFGSAYAPDSAEVPLQNPLRSRSRPYGNEAWDDSSAYDAPPDWGASRPRTDPRSYSQRQRADSGNYPRRMPEDDDDWGNSRPRR